MGRLRWIDGQGRLIVYFTCGKGNACAANVDGMGVCLDSNVFRRFWCSCAQVWRPGNAIICKKPNMNGHSVSRARPLHLEKIRYIMIVYIYIYMQTGYLSAFAPDWSLIANPDSIPKKRKHALTNSAPKRYHSRRKRKPDAAFRDSLSQNSNPINRLSRQNVLRLPAKRDHTKIKCFTPDVSRRAKSTRAFKTDPRRL